MIMTLSLHCDNNCIVVTRLQKVGV